MIRIINHQHEPIPMTISKVSAGFPSPADDHLEDDLDLHDFLVSKPSATFLVRATGNSMRGIGIYDGDVLVVDRSEKALDGSVIVAAIDGECLVKTLRMNQSGTWLQAAHPNYQPIHINEHVDFAIWGVVVGVVRKHKDNGRVCTR